MHHLEPFHSKYCNIAFALALFLPDVATFVSASGILSLMIAIITWLAIGVLFADSVLAWALFRPEARTGADLNVMLICEVIGMSLLALHALTITATDGEALWFIGARWFRSAQLPLLRIAGRRAVLDTKVFREKVCYFGSFIVKCFRCKRSVSVSPANIIAIDYSPPVWSMYHESAQFAGLALVIMASMLTISLSVTMVEPIIRARRSSLIQLAGCNSIASSLGSSGSAVYDSIANTLKDESSTWSMPHHHNGFQWDMSYAWGSILPTKFQVDHDDGTTWSSKLSDGYASFVEDGRQSSMLSFEVGRCSLQLSARSSQRFVALLDAITSIIVILVVHLVVWGLVPGAPPSPEHDRDPLLGPLRRTWLRFYMVPELHASLHTVTEPKHKGNPTDVWDLSKDVTGVVATLKHTPSLTEGIGKSIIGNKRASWVSRTIPIGEKKLIREVAAMARGLIGLNVGLDAIDDETGGIFGRVTKNTMFGTEDHATGGGDEGEASAGGLDEQTKWLLEGFTRADRDDFEYDGPSNAPSGTVTPLEVSREVTEAAIERRSSIRSSVKESNRQAIAEQSLRRSSSESNLKMEIARTGSATLSSLNEKVATVAAASETTIVKPLRRSISLFSNRVSAAGGSQTEQDISQAIESAAEAEKTAELQAYRNAFDLLDTDESGALSVDEIEDAMTALGKAPPSKEVLHALVTAADLDGNGEIDFDEFVSMMQQFGEAEDVVGDGSSSGSFMEGNAKLGSRDALSLQLIDRVMGAFKEQAVRMLKHQAYGGPAMVAPGISPPRPSDLSLDFFPPLPSPEEEKIDEDVDEDLQALSAAATAYGAPGISPSLTAEPEPMQGVQLLKKVQSSMTEEVDEEEVFSSALTHVQASELAFQILMANGALETLGLGDHTAPLRTFVDALASAYGDSTSFSNDRHAMESEEKIGAVGDCGGFGKKASNTKAYAKRGDGGAPFHGWHRAVDVALTIHHLLHAMEGYLHPNGFNNHNGDIGVVNASFNQGPGSPSPTNDAEGADDVSPSTSSSHSHRVSALFHGVSEKLYLTGKGHPKAIRIMNPAEKLAVFLAALGHGLGHDGLSTGYHVQVGTPVAMFYNDKNPNENRSLAILFELLGTPPLSHVQPQQHPSPSPSQSSSAFSSGPPSPVSSSGGTNALVSRMDPKSYRILRKALVRNLLQSSMGNHATRVSSLRLFAFEHGATPPPAAAAAKAAAASKESNGSKNSDLGTMSPQAAAFAAASATKRSCDLLRISFGPNAPKDKRDKSRILIQQTVLHAGFLCTCACRSRNHAMYKAWVNRQHREWWKQAMLEQSHNLNKTTPFAVAAANPDVEGPAQKDIAEIEMGLFEQVILPFLVPLFDLFPPTRFLAKPLAENHTMTASDRRRELSAEYRRAERRLNFANTVTERLIGVSRAPRRNTGSTFRSDRDSSEQAADSVSVASRVSASGANEKIRSSDYLKGDEMKNEDDSDASMKTTQDIGGLSPSGSGPKKSLMRSNSGNWLRGAAKKFDDSVGSEISSSPTSEPSNASTRKSNPNAVTNWAAGLRWAAERADKLASERAVLESEQNMMVWPSMTELRTSSMAAAAAAKANQLAVQKARLHLEARAAAFTETLLPYVKKS